MKAIDFHKYTDAPSGKEITVRPSMAPFHFYPDTNEVYTCVGEYIGQGEIKDNKLYLTWENS